MRALSVIDVILGEATSGTRAQRYEDMLAIASTIENRARASNGLSHLDIVSDSREFNAYNRALPPGSSRYRSLAQKALQDVVENGPVHAGMYYATPRAVGNLPAGLAAVTSTTGHRFFVDPLQRAFRTAVGFVKPSAPQMPWDGPVPTPRPTPVLDRIQSAIDPVVDVAQGAVSTIGKGFEALVPGGLKHDFVEQPTEYPAGYEDMAPRAMSPVSFDLGPKRPQAPDRALVSKIQDAVTDVLGPGYSVEVYSGKQSASKQYGSNRHTTGLAADVRIYDPAGKMLTPATHRQEMLDVGQAFSAKGGLGVGLGAEYMNQGIHLDMVDPNPALGQDYEWGSIGNANKGLLADAREFAAMPDSYMERMLPDTMDAPSPNLTAPAPEKVARAPLDAPIERVASPSSAASVARPAPSPQVTERNYPSLGTRPSLAPTPGDRLAPTGPDARVVGTEVTRSLTPEQATAAAQTAPSIAPDMSRPVTADPAPSGPVQPDANATLQKIIDAYDYMAKTRAAAPLAPVAPSLPPPQAVQPRPVYQPSVAAPAPPRAPVAPPAPSFTASDVYGGQASEALDSTGKNKVSRDDLGRTSVENEFGVETVMNGGYQSAGSITPSDPLADMLDDGKSSLSKGGLSKFRDKLPDGQTVAGTIIGGLIGNVIGGPVVGAVGAKLGAKVAKGDITQNSALSKLLGYNQVNTSKVNLPGIGRTTRFANPVKGLAFPDAPAAPTDTGGTNNLTDRERRERGREISPRAQDAIDRGLAGLY